MRATSASLWRRPGDGLSGPGNRYARAEPIRLGAPLLDEVTASLDLATERRVAAATEVPARRRTTVVVAHRLTTAVRADRVVVLDAGTVVETGTHTGPLAADGPHRRLRNAFRETGHMTPVDHLNASELVEENAG